MPEATLKKMQINTKGSLLGATLLVAGCCIGAGMLGIPVITAPAGLAPSLAFFIIGWLYMVTTALILLEVTLWFPVETSVAGMAEAILGPIGKWIAWALMFFLMYCLMTAYASGSGALLSQAFSITQSQGSILFLCLLGTCLTLGMSASDYLNRFLMIGLIVSYCFLIAIGIPTIHPENLTHSNWSAGFYVAPILVIAFGFHNLIPSLTKYLHRDLKKLRWSIFLGTLLPLLIYSVWEILVLGLIPAAGTAGFQEGRDQGAMATQLLSKASNSQQVILLAQCFAFFSITTSFIGNAVSISDFIGAHWKGPTALTKRTTIAILTLLPPLLFSLLYPHLFLNALSFAGAYGAVTLFGILPILMAWKGRERFQNPSQTSGHTSHTPGQTSVRIFSQTWNRAITPLIFLTVLIVSLTIIGLQLFHDFFR